MHALCSQPIAGEPFPGSKTGEPRHVELMRAAFKLRDPPEAMWALTRRELVAALAHDKFEEALERIFDKYEDYKERHDLVVIEGTHEGQSFSAAACLRQAFVPACTTGLRLASGCAPLRLSGGPCMHRHL